MVFLAKMVYDVLEGLTLNIEYDSDGDFSSSIRNGSQIFKKVIMCRNKSVLF